MIGLVLAALTAAAPCSELPLAPGTTWTYRAEVAWTIVGSDSVQRRTIRWTASILSVETRDSISVAIVKDWLSGLAWWDPTRTEIRSLIVCEPGRIYHIQPSDTVSAALVDSLLDGRQRPSEDDLILRFPLRTGDLFGRDAPDRDDTFYAWFVESARAMPADLARMETGASDSLFTLAYRSLPDHQFVDFAPGLGVTRYVYGHHGTVAQADAVLIGYRAGRGER